ncbi:MAG: SCO6745 family protein [Acidimicrobiales bacterium]
MDPALARRLWTAIEPYHVLVYFAPEARGAYRQIGLKGYWMGYFASRAAPMGPVPPEVVTATFFNFHPAMVRRAVPDAWSFAPLDRILAARSEVADAALRRILGEDVASPAVREAAQLGRQAAEAADPAGRPLFAGHASLPWPDDPHLALWHAATLLREHRGDGHTASLLTSGLDGCQAHVTLVAAGGQVRGTIQPNRGWSDEDWGRAEDDLRRRGWLDAGGALTQVGREGREAVEHRTDELAMGPWERAGAGATERLVELVTPLSARIVASGEVPVPNPAGWPGPS